MARPKLPQWKKDAMKRLADQFKEFAKTKDKPEHLTKWTYHNGRVEIRQVRVESGKAWGRRRYKYVRQQVWIPNEHANQAANQAAPNPRA